MNDLEFYQLCFNFLCDVPTIDDWRLESPYKGRPGGGRGGPPHPVSQHGMKPGFNCGVFPVGRDGG